MNGSPTGNHSDVSSCKLLLDDGDLTDGKIPQLLGLCLAAWLVRNGLNEMGNRFYFYKMGSIECPIATKGLEHVIVNKVGITAI